jgi:hypothetical protein
MHPFSLPLGLTLFLLAGCSIKPDGGGEAGSSGADTDTTIGHSSAPTSDGPDTASDGPGAATDASATSQGPGGDPTTSPADSDTDSSGGDPPSSCQLVCQHALECGLDDDPACATACEADIAAAAGACIKPLVVMLDCFAGLDCAGLGLALGGELGHACDAELLAQLDACAVEPDTCDTAGGGDMEGTSCMLDLQCPGELPQRMECDTRQCVCFEDDVQVGACAADGVCSAPEQLNAKAAACCGFQAGP